MTSCKKLLTLTLANIKNLVSFTVQQEVSTSFHNIHVAASKQHKGSMLCASMKDTKESLASSSVPMEVTGEQSSQCCGQFLVLLALHSHSCVEKKA